MKILLALEGPVMEGPNVLADSIFQNLVAQHHNRDGNIVKQVKTTNLKSLIKAIFCIRQFDIFHFYSESLGAALLFLLFKLFRKKIVYTLHGNMKIEAKYKPWPINWLWIPAHLFVMKNVDVVTFPSKYLKSSMQIYFRSKKIVRKSKFNHHVIPNGTFVGEYPSKLIRAKSKKLKEIRNGQCPLHILSMTSFYFEPKTRGVDLLMETNKILNESGIKTEIEIGGIGHQLDDYKKKYETHNVKFLGYCDNYKENKWADVFVHLSFLDNLPIVILNAGVVGLPSIASEIGGIPEIFCFSENKTVWGLTRNVANTVANKIMKLISDEKFYLKVSKVQYTNITEHFNISTICNQFWTLYKNL